MDPIVIISFAILIFSVVLHELGHGYAALWLGDNTAKRLGRLSFNPIPHIDIFYTILLPAFLYWTGAPILGGAKPVPVQPQQFMGVSPRKGMMLVAAAGPAVNFVLAAAGLAFLHLAPSTAPKILFSSALALAFINFVLGMFNLMPIPPLDGSKVIAGLIPKEAAYAYMKLERFGFIILLAVVLTGVHRPLLNLGLQFFKMLLP